MSILNPDMTEIIEERRRRAADKPEKATSMSVQRKIDLKHRMDEVNYQRELDRINNFED